ncbi:hypothetical protein GTO91_16200 [Heliobacterium undosum]|uniref:SLH domain-containing protein n=1 Tax=Heliomicrobium undosum TaxID=121734 RepID=A0A845L7I7_9FIRM|nr:S-layer homology domain-containing protein [Heliomicrobium undosum]MZP31249.1 hypothetical protein [Heliomicrobium undosum]
MKHFFGRSPKYRQWVSVLIATLILAVMTSPFAALAADAKSSPATQIPPLFTDVSGHDPDYVFINYSLKRGMLNGLPDGSFHPDEGLTRAQAAFLLAKQMNLRMEGIGKSPFPDVPADHWAEPAIAASSRAGMLKGFEDGTYRPDDPLTRIQSVVLLLRLEKTSLPAVNRSFTDIPADYWARNQAAVAVEAGMVSLPNGSSDFSPDSTFTRRELARALAMLYTLAPSLRQAELPMKLVVKEGKTTLTSGSASTQVKTESPVKAGDSIAVETGSAELLFDDGTGFLIKKGTRMTVKEARGRAYIKNRGIPGISVDWLRIEMPEGHTVGVLATNRILSKTGASPAAMIRPDLRLAAASDDVLGEALLRLRLAEDGQGAGDEEWWKVASEEKTRIQMDMAWGVAAVQGTRFAARGAGDGGSFSVMDGRGSISAAGQSFAVPPGLETTVAAPGQPPAPPAPLSPAAIESFVAAQSFLTQQAALTVQNQPAPVALPPALQASLTPTVAPTPVPPAVPPAIQTLYQSINQVEATAATSLSNNTVTPSSPAAPSAPTASTSTTPSTSRGSGGGGSNGGTPVEVITYDVSVTSSQNQVTIQGTLKRNNNVLPNTDVTLRVTGSNGTNVLFDQTITDASGHYSFQENLEPGLYTIYVGGVGSPQSVQHRVFQNMTGSGTEMDPFVIYTLEGLNRVRDNLSAYYQLGADIDAAATSTWNAGSGWLPIGTAEQPFTGKFKGNGHKINNLFINRELTDNVGLFGYTSDASIERLGLTNAFVKGNDSVGVLAGSLLQDSTLNRCYVSGFVYGNEMVGGLIGQAYQNVNGSVCAIQDSYVTATVFGAWKVGGLIGKNQQYDVKNCYASGSVSGQEFLGGLIGYNDSATVSSSFALNAAFVNNGTESAPSFGRIAGSSSGTFVDNYALESIAPPTLTMGSMTWSPNSTGKDGANLSIASASQSSSYIGWDFANIWAIGTPYPVLRN